MSCALKIKSTNDKIETDRRSRHFYKYKPSWVYLLMGSNGIAKIGRSDNPIWRARELRRYELRGARVVWAMYVYDAEMVERAFHRYYDRYCLDNEYTHSGNKREYFKLPDDVISEFADDFNVIKNTSMWKSVTEKHSDKMISSTEYRR